MNELPDNYACFLNALNGLIDDAEMSRWDEHGLTHLREAFEFFSSDYRIRKQTEIEASERETELRRKYE